MQTPKQSCIEIQIDPHTLALVRRAAEIQGRSVSDFVVAAAEESARKTIKESNLIALAPEPQQRFAEALIDPPGLTPPLLRAKEAHARLIEIEPDISD
jgi:uncharacterized protein (DUF1778 family)